MTRSFKNILLAFVLGASLFSCKKDNYDPPESMLSGALLYGKDTVYVEYDRVPYQLFQYGFGKVGPIGSAFKQDGTFSSLLFDGEYKFTIPPGQGPFKWKELSAGVPDSVAVTVRGNTSFNVEVNPYYMVRNLQVTAGANKVNATFAADKIITGADGKNIERVNLYINKTQFVSGANNIAWAEISGGAITDPSAITISKDIPSIQPTQNYVFVRVGIKIEGVEDMIFSPLKRVNF